MEQMGMPTKPQDLLYDQAAARRAYIGSREIRDKYLLSSMLWDLGLMKDERFMP